MSTKMSANMAADQLQAAQSLIISIRNLATDDSYKAIAGIVDEISLLKKQLGSKDQEANDLRAKIGNLEKSHLTRLQDELELFRTQHNKLEVEKTDLSKTIGVHETTIDERDGTITKLKQALASSHAQFERAKKSLEDEKTKLSTSGKEITRLQKSWKSKETEVESLKESLSKLQDIEKKNNYLTEKLQENTTKLREFEGFGVNLHVEEEVVWARRLDKLWGSARRLVESHLSQNLSERALQDWGAWKPLRESQYIAQEIPLPRSNSLAAKQMRIAAILAILARSIDQYIFQPTYLFEKDEEIRVLLNRLAAKNSKKESFCRSLLLSIFPEDQDKHVATGVETVVTDVAWCVRNLLQDPQYESFRSGLEKVVQQARDAWRIMQRDVQKFESYFELNFYEEPTWLPLTFSDGAKENGMKPSETDKELLVIFPRIYIIENGEPDPITPGVVLMQSQTVEAALEVKNEGSSSPTDGRPGLRSRPNRSRTKSMSMNSENGFLSKQTPLSAH